MVDLLESLHKPLDYVFLCRSPLLLTVLGRQKKLYYNRGLLIKRCIFLLLYFLTRLLGETGIFSRGVYSSNILKKIPPPLFFNLKTFPVGKRGGFLISYTIFHVKLLHCKWHWFCIYFVPVNSHIHNSETNVSGKYN